MISLVHKSEYLAYIIWKLLFFILCTHKMEDVIVKNYTPSMTTLLSFQCIMTGFCNRYDSGTADFM